jgi:flavin reductase (DIM6/NTAB) family NADH-FMN oxidoreductase RutF
MKNLISPWTNIFPTPALVVAACDGKGKAAAMTAAWGGACRVIFAGAVKQ